jgi:hypothetical protein
MHQGRDREAEGLDGGDGLPFEFFCECSELSCKRLVELTVAGFRERSRSGSVLAGAAGRLKSANADGPTAA